MVIIKDQADKDQLTVNWQGPKPVSFSDSGKTVQTRP